MTRCAVIGGGLLGMTLALRLAREGWGVTIYEQSAGLGGLAAPWRLGGAVWDRHYHVILRSDEVLLTLLGELGLRDQIAWGKARSNFFINGEMHPFTTTLDHLRFPAIGMLDKIRLALMVERTKRRDDWEALEGLDVENWLRAQCGDRVFERIWRPLLLAKLGEAYHRVNAAFIWATIRRLYAGSGEFGCLQTGYRAVIERLARALVHAGVRIRCATAIHSVRRANGGLAVEAADGTRTYDRVALTIPTPAIATIARALSDEERDRLRAIEYQGIVCASLLLDRPLGSAYITNVADARIPFTAAIEMSALVGSAPFGHRHLVYLPRYCSPRDPYFVLGDREARDTAVAALQRMYPAFRASTVRAFRVSRVPAVFALPVRGYSSRLPGFATSEPGVYIATSAQIVNGTLNVNDTLELSGRAAQTILNDPRFDARAGGLHEAAS